MSSDQRIQELLNDFAGRPDASLHDRVRDRLAAARRGKRRAAHLRWAFAAAFALLVALGAFVSVPRVTVARKLREVHDAIARAQSVQFTMVRRTGSRERVVFRAWIEGRNSRRRRSYSPGAAVDTVVKDGVQYTYAEGAPTAVQEPAEPGKSPDELDASGDALEFAKEITASPEYWAPSDVDIQPHPDVDGRRTFCIVAARNDGRSHASMVVDSATDLPISLTLDMPGQERSATTKTVSNFTFNKRIDRRVFEPEFGPNVSIVVAPAPKPSTSEVLTDSEPSEFVDSTGAVYTPDTMYSIRYGSEQGQIGVKAPAEGAQSGETLGNAGFAIRKGGNLIIADRVGGRIEEFDPHATLVMCTAGTLENPTYVAAGPDGSVFAVSGAHGEVLTKFGRRGETLWSVRGPEVLPPALHLDGTFGEITVCDDGSPATRLENTDWMVRFTADGKFDCVRPAVAATPDGGMLSFVPAGGEPDATDGVLLDAAGRILSKTRLEPPKTDASELGDIGESSGAVRDARGFWYRVWVRRKDKRVELSPNMEIRSEAVVVKYGPDGQVLTQGVVDVSPFDFPQSFALDPDGRLYILSYHDDKVSLVRYRL
jgi:outer membrane lipoprotein-sorting protein